MNTVRVNSANLIVNEDNLIGEVAEGQGDALHQRLIF